LKKPAGSVRFRFYKQKTEKTESNRNKKNQKKTKPNWKNGAKTGKNRAKTEKTEPNRFEPVFALKNRTEPKPVGLTRFRFFLKKFGLVTFFDKNRTEQKIITPTTASCKNPQLLIYQQLPRGKRRTELFGTLDKTSYLTLIPMQVFYFSIKKLNIHDFNHNFKTRSGPADRPKAGTEPGWKKKQRKKKTGVARQTWSKTRLQPVYFFFLLKWRCFDFLKNKNWLRRPDDPVKTRNPELGPGRV